MKIDGLPAWHALDEAAALASLESSRNGLSDESVQARLRSTGENRLTPPPKRSALMRFFSQFNNVLIHVLLASALMTAWLAAWVDTGVIMGVVVINALIGFIQEGNAEKSLEAIRNMLSLSATVIRQGIRQQCPAAALVPGDIVLLAAGDRVPADLRLFEAYSLRIDEAALTGESEPVEKGTAAVPAALPVADRTSMAYSGTLVIFGQGRGVVVATGDRTEIGQIGRLLATVNAVETPLLRQMDRFGRILTVGVLLVSALALLFGLLVHGGAADQLFMAAVGLAVAAIPEGLPAIMTITLAIGVQKMAARNAIVRHMPAVEALGAVTVICSDKTGTLTRNEMMVSKLVTVNAQIEVGGEGYAPIGGFSRAGNELDLVDLPILSDIARIALLCNDASLVEDAGHWQLIGDPTEGALLALAGKAGLDPHHEHAANPRIDTLPFDAAHRFMATLHHDHAGHAFVFLKGAPEAIFKRCHWQCADHGDETLHRPQWDAQVAHLAAQGFRVLALARGTMPSGHRELSFSDVDAGLTLYALLAIIDPPREDAVRAVAACRSAGISVKMITGDHAVTAAAIARSIGIGDAAGRTLTGSEIEAMDDPALATAVRQVDLFARASPEHKLRLVRAMQSTGAVVAMTGDGVNDAPALKRADVGVAMGRKGTEAAKEAAEVVLADDNFASISAAVEEGRTVYDNLRKAIAYVLPTSSGQAAMVLLAVLLGITLPITPVQILWVNMVTAVTLSLALAFEQPEPGIMQRPPRDPDESLVTPFMLWRIVFVSVLLVGMAMGLFLWETARGNSLEMARTAAVNALVVGEIFYLFNCRRLTASVISRDGLFGNRYALGAAALLVLLQLLLTYLPLAWRLFGTAPLDFTSWWVTLLMGLLLFFAVELEKACVRRLHRA